MNDKFCTSAEPGARGQQPATHLALPACACSGLGTSSLYCLTLVGRDMGSRKLD
jgi:hypothetical protein